MGGLRARVARVQRSPPIHSLEIASLMPAFPLVFESILSYRVQAVSGPRSSCPALLSSPLPRNSKKIPAFPLVFESILSYRVQAVSTVYGRCLGLGRCVQRSPPLPSLEIATKYQRFLLFLKVF